MKLIGRSSREGATLPGSIPTDITLAPVRLKKSKKRLAEVKSFSLDEPLQSDVGIKSERAALVRSKTYDSTQSQKTSDYDPSLERRTSISSNLPKHKLTFQKIFRDVPEDEELIDSFTCALQREVLYQGRLYISQNYLGFYCSMLRKEIKVRIPVTSIIVLKKANTALLVPNALSIRTIEGEKYLFGSLRNREMSYHAVRAVCLHLQDGSTCNTPLSYPAEPNLEQCNKTPERTSLSNSSHSDLEQTPHEWDSTENCASEAVLPFQVHERKKLVLNEVDGPVQNTLNGDVHKDKMTSDTTHTQWSNPQIMNVLLVIYMLLVLVLLFSSGYIGLRIMALESQLNIMGAWPKGDETQGLQDT